MPPFITQEIMMAAYNALIPYTRITTRTFDVGCDYTADWMRLTDEGMRLWKTYASQDASMQRYSSTNGNNAFDRVLEGLKGEPGVYAALLLSNLVASVEGQGFKSWINAGAGRHIHVLLEVLDDIPGPDTREVFNMVETILPYIDIDPETWGEWVTSVVRREVNGIEIDVEDCLIWERLPEMTERFKQLEHLVPEIGAYFMITYGE